MIDNSNLMLALLATFLIGLPVAVCIDHAGTEPPLTHTKPVVIQEEARYEPDGQQASMDALLDQVAQDSLLHTVEHLESHGNPSAVSKKGAKGRYQIMDATAMKPGFGVMPMQNHSEAEQRRFAKEYLAAIRQHFHRLEEKLELAAYNGGVGRVDTALKEAFAKLPIETQVYVAKAQQFADNGE